MAKVLFSGTSVSPILVGVAGEYFVAAELSRLGLVASITLRNTKGIDILVSNPEGSRSISIQVKTSHRSAKRWILTKSAEGYVGADLFYVFVALNEPRQQPTYHVVPSNDVAEQIKGSHRAWLASPNKSGGQHKDNPMRMFLDTENFYLDRWDLITRALGVDAFG